VWVKINWPGKGTQAHLPKYLPLDQTWVEAVAQAIAKQIEGEHGIRHGQPREEVPCNDTSRGLC
jgi:hypothetical protein